MNKKETMQRILSKYLFYSLDCDNSYFDEIEEKIVVYKDVLFDIMKAQEDLRDNDIEKASMKKNDEIDKVLYELRENGILVIDKKAVCIEINSCNNCPAYQWVIHQKGIHTCRLAEKIVEKCDGEGNWSAAPIGKCIRPVSIGACYLIAKGLGLPEPLVGKLTSEQYIQYCKEREQLCP